MHSRRSTRTVFALVALIALVLLSACGGGTQPTTTKPADTKPAAQAPAPAPTAQPAAKAAPAAAKTLDQITIAINANPRTLDPTTVVDGLSRGIFIQLFDPLIHRLPDNKIENRLAEKYDQVNDKLVRITLRQNVKFSDGTPVTADDVKYTLDLYRNKNVSEGASLFATTKDVRQVDARTIEIETSVADPIFKETLADIAFIVPKATHSKDPKAFARQPIGSGPYVFKNWVQGDRLEMDRREDYWGPKPMAKKVIWKPIPDASARVAALLSGQVDIADEIPATQAAAVNANPATTIKAQAARNVNYIAFKWDDPILKNQKVRQALNHGVNREAVVKAVLNGFGKVQQQMLLEGMPGYVPGYNPYPYDPDKAKRLLAEAGYPNGFKLDIEIPMGGPMVAAKESAEAVAGDLRKIGVNVNLITTEWAAFFKKWFTPPRADLAHSFVFYIRMPSMDPEEEVGRMFKTGSPVNANNYNVKEVHDLLMAGAGTVDVAARAAAYKRVNEVMTADPPWLFLFQPETLVGVKKSVPWERPGANMIWVVDMLEGK